MRPSISPLPTSTPWNSRCAACMVRSVENPSLRLASCVSVDVVNGGAGRSTPGFSSTAVTVHGRCAQRAAVGLGQHARVLAGQRALLVEVLAGRDAFVPDSRQRRGEFTPVAGETR